MIMKKLIAIAVVFALVAGGVFAVDLTGTVFGGVRLFQGSNYWNPGDPDSDTWEDDYPGLPTDFGWMNINQDMKMRGSAGMSRIRLEGSGEAGDGNFGGWYRIEANASVYGLAWWKPIDMFKMSIGGNPDGIFGKEGYSGWMFYQMPCDVGIANNGNTWGGGYLYWTAKFRNAFYAGIDQNALLLEVKPVDMFGLNIVLPYFQFSGAEVKDIFKHMTIQADVNLDFGNIALTFDLIDNEVDPEKIGAKLYLYFGLSAIDNLSLDVGVGFTLPQSISEDFGGTSIKMTRMNPIAFGVAAQFDVNDSFGLRARLLAEFMGSTKVDVSGVDPENDPMVVGVDLLPYFGISDSMKVFFSVGLGMASHKDWEKALISWHVNPYLQVGAQWGPTFYAGVRLWSSGEDTYSLTWEKKSKAFSFEVPIGIQVSF
jgi:hypothetical protein